MDEEYEPLETRIVEQLIKVLDSGMGEKQHDEEMFRLLAKYKSRLIYIEKQYKKEKYG